MTSNIVMLFVKCSRNDVDRRVVFSVQGCGFQPKHRGEEQSCVVKELRRYTSYRFRVSVGSFPDTTGTSNVIGFYGQTKQE